MDNELQLRTGPYRTTFVGTEITRVSTQAEWQNYGEILKRIDEAKQWAIGDWLVDGKTHYGDGLYERASKIIEYDKRTLEGFKYIAEKYEITLRNVNLSWQHHKEVSSIKKTHRPETGKWEISKEPDNDKIQEFLHKAEKENLSIRELRVVIKEYKNTQQREIELANEPDKYKIVYADPPWQYRDTCEDGAIQGKGADKHYPTMTISELCNLPVKNFTTENSVLFLWVTSPLLKECWPVINSWGFEYKSSFIWDKTKHNMGHYNSVRHEFLLVCTKGSCLPQNSKLFNSVQSIEKSDVHSEKPETFREIIDEMYPEGKRIELFARRKPVGRWKVWGNEV